LQGEKMKKIVVFLLVGLIVIGCVSAPKGISIKDFEGVWEQVDGSSVFTFSGRNWEIVDIERGIAGYGTFKLEDRMRDRGENRIVFTNICTVFLDIDEEQFKDLPRKAKKTFIVKAWEDYKISVLEINGTGGFSEGGRFGAFELNGNYLRIEKIPDSFGNPDKIITDENFIRMQILEQGASEKYGGYESWGAFTGDFIRI
jgi:hypothetical protein